jgi:4-hydroxyproline epimerase
VLFFNNVGMLGMCVHGTIGVVATLAYLGKIKPGTIKLDTPVGVVGATLDAQGLVSVRNVRSYRYRKDVVVSVPEYGDVTGDIAWGGNWFFLVNQHQEALTLSNVERLTDVSWRIRQALQSNGHTGANNEEIDHIELFGPPANPRNHSRNFVLCPGKAYDRSPCGTGTSAKLACLHTDGKLKPGETWRQEGIVGSVFEGSVEPLDQGVIPTVRGSAYITADATLIFNPDDPFRAGLRP